MVFRNVKTSLEYATEEPEAAQPQRRRRHHERGHLHQALQLCRRRSLQAEVRIISFIFGMVVRKVGPRLREFASNIGPIFQTISINFNCLQEKDICVCVCVVQRNSLMCRVRLSLLHSVYWECFPNRIKIDSSGAQLKWLYENLSKKDFVVLKSRK